VPRTGPAAGNSLSAAHDESPGRWTWCAYASPFLQFSWWLGPAVHGRAQTLWGGATWRVDRASLPPPSAMRTRVLPVPSSTRAPVDERLAPGGCVISGGRLILYDPPLQFATRMPRGGERG